MSVVLPIKVKLKVNTDPIIRLKCSTAIQPVVGDIYDGEYEVIPSAHNDIVLETDGKLCDGDITVKIIQTYETRNDYGYSFYIADEV